MQVWKRRLVFLVAVAAGSAGLMMSSASAQVPPGFELPELEFPEFPEFPGFPFPSPSTSPPPTGPPPTMPPPTSPTTSPPPPTMPPPTTSPPSSSPPPTMPPTTIDVGDSVDEFVENLIDQLEQTGEDFEELVDTIQDILNSF
jgi:hypothetical protein